MGQFKYKAVTTQGEVLQGVFKARNRAEVVQMLRGNQSYPISVEEEYSGEAREVRLFKGIGTKNMAIFCRQLYGMLNAGVPIVTCLDTLRQQTDNKRLKKVIGELYEDVHKGVPLSEGMKKHPDFFSDLMTYMVAAGETSGFLDVIMERLSVYYEKETRIRNKLKGAMVYPIILSIVAVAVVAFLVSFVLPTFIDMFRSGGVEVPLPTKILIFISELLRNYWYVIIGAVVGLGYLLNRYIHTPKGRWRYDWLKLNLPIVKGLNQKIITARFTRTLSTMLLSGIPMLQALENVENVVGNRLMVDGLRKTREEVQRGMDLATPIRRYCMFPPMVPNMIHIGEESGTLDDMMSKTANFYDDEVDLALQQMVTLFEPLMIILMAFVVGFIVISIALPLFDSFQAVKNMN